MFYNVNTGNKLITNIMKKVKSPFNVMAFPHGPICNLACDYCYYLNKKSLYPDTTDFRMSEELLEEYTKQFIEAHPGPLVPFGWQGGEPTLRGLDFFKKALEFQQKYLPEDWQVQNAFQTNGILLDDDWCQFLKENDFLVGISIDGPADVHDVYRKDQQGRPSHQRVIDGLHKLQKHGVEYNVLCVVDDVNSQKPLDVYNFFKEEGVEFIQFIPIVETDENGEATSRSVSGEAYGRFLLEVFDEWIYHDFSEIIIQIFEECVSVWAGRGANLCVFSRTCGLAPVMEHNGDLYSCDHFVFPEYKLGNIRETHLGEMINSDKQKQFGLSKKDDLPQVCQDCDVRFMCNGGCLRNRIIPTDDGKKLNYVCSGYKQFFHYIAPYMNEIVDCLRENFHLRIIKKRLQFLHDQIWDVGRNDPCPCGSGKKFKKCCISRK